MITDIKLNKPTPILLNKDQISYKHGTDVEKTIQNLVQGKFILINGFYNDGISLLQDLHKYLKLKLPYKSFNDQRDYRSEFFKLSNLILLEITNQKL